ncbi:MAG TPA: aspartate aminotransferase family protein [Atribacterota bacterium]|nr:aspartate aminotransferase family protein [Atribacterota bacterium]
MEIAKYFNQSSVFYSSVNSEYVVVDKAQGMYLYDTKGKKYLDAAGGVAVVTIGHSVPEVIDAITEQAKKVSYVYGGTFTSEARIKLAEKIIKMSPRGMDKVFFCSGGSEAVESAIKIARQFQLEKGYASKYKVISRWQSYHGNTIATLSIGGRPSWRAKYTPYLLQFPHIAQCNCYRCPYGLEYPECNIRCARELERVIKYEGAETVSAFILEPIIGTTDTAVVPPNEYFSIIRNICDKYKVLLIVDEVITGMGRTGKNFAVDHFNVIPDIIATAKGLGSGYTSIGSVIVHKKITDAIINGTGELTHSFTYSGNPLVCATGLAVVEYLEKNNLVQRSAEMGKIFLNKLYRLKKLPMIGDVRGIGLLLGVELVKNKETKEPYEPDKKVNKLVSNYCRENGVLIVSGVTGSSDGISGDCLQISPPFIISEEEIDFVVEVLGRAINDVYDKLK